MAYVSWPLPKISLKFRLSEQADIDLDSIWSFIAVDDVKAANGLIDRITDTFDWLAETPLAGRARPELRANVRSFAVRGYTIFYTISAGGIEIVRILHGRQDIDPVDFA